METKNFLRVTGISLILVIFVFSSLVQADVYIKEKKHTDAYQVMGQTMPAKDEIIITWMTQDKARINEGKNTSMIIRLDKNAMYIIDHTRKTYEEMPIGNMHKILRDAIAKQASEEKEAEEMAEFMKGFTSAMTQMEATVTDTGERKKIKGWNCQKYILKMKMPMGISTSEIWATKDIKIDYEKYRKISTALISKQPGFKSILKEIEKIKGFQVLNISSSRSMGANIKITHELLEIKEKSAPSGIYEIPRGYVKVRNSF